MKKENGPLKSRAMRNIYLYMLGTFQPVAL